MRGQGLVRGCGVSVGLAGSGALLGGWVAGVALRALAATAYAASATNSSIAVSLRYPAAAELGNSCARPQAVKARAARTGMRRRRCCGGWARVPAMMAAAMSSSGAAEMPGWWAQWLLPAIPSVAMSRALTTIAVTPSPMVAQSRRYGGWVCGG